MSLGDIKSLSEAVMADAMRERERIMSDAESLARTTRDRARDEAEIESKKIVEDATSRAQRLLEQTRATVRLEAQSLKLERRELLLTNVFELAMSRLSDVRSLENYRSAAILLVRDAVDHMDRGSALVVLADDVAHEFFDELTLSQLNDEMGCELSLGPVLTDGTGVIVQSVDGHMVYDNTLQARLDRYRSSLRASVFQILQGGA